VTKNEAVGASKTLKHFRNKASAITLLGKIKGTIFHRSAPFREDFGFSFLFLFSSGG